MDNERKKIILVDDQIVNLTAGRNALAEKYDVFTVPSGTKLLTLIPKVMPDMILLDIEMPDMNGYDVIKLIKRQPDMAHIPVIFLTSKDDKDSELEGLVLGAIDYISKPFMPTLLLKRIEVHLLVDEQKRKLQDYNDNLKEMVREKTQTILELQNAILDTMAELVECRDDITGGHIGRTRKYLGILIDGLIEQKIYSQESATWDIEMIILSSQLHDVGKIAISDNILRKPDKLTDAEFEEIKKHTLFGGTVIEKIQKRTGNQAFLDYAKMFAVYHHEKWDGTGYPYGLKANNIPLLARLMAIVDVYDALLSERPYKKPFQHDKAVQIIKEDKGTRFDPILVDLFISVADRMTNSVI